MSPSPSANASSSRCRGYAKGTVFTLATAVRDDVKVLSARMGHWKLEPAGAKRWGGNSEVNYRDYVDFMLKWGGAPARPLAISKARGHT